MAKCRHITFFCIARSPVFFLLILVKSDYGYHCRTLNLIRCRFIQLRLISFPFFSQRIHSRLSSMSELTARWCKRKLGTECRTIIYANPALFIVVPIDLWFSRRSAAFLFCFYKCSLRWLEALNNAVFTTIAYYQFAARFR